jgi:hypothetical protein
MPFDNSSTIACRVKANRRLLLIGKKRFSAQFEMANIVVSSEFLHATVGAEDND